MGTKTIASDRVWLNPRDVNCMAAVHWNVEVWYNREKKTGEISAQININDEGRSHWVSRKAELKPIRTMRRVLNEFEAAVEQGFEWIQSQGYTVEKPTAWEEFNA